MNGHRDGVSDEYEIALEALSLLSKKWHPVVILTLSEHGPMGFNDLLDAIQDVSGKVLSDTLTALEEAGLVDRRVVSESPLRVEYALAPPGAEMEPIFSALSAWGGEYLRSATPAVLIADGDRRITEMYEQWVTDRYRVLRAHNGREFSSALDESIDLVLIDEDLPGADGIEALSARNLSCRTVLLVGDRPDFDVLDVDCDDVLRKPIVRETALEAIETQLNRRGESPEERRRNALAAKREALESVYSPDRLEGIDRYQDLCSRIEGIDP